jgi:tRNA modification GTPase
VQVIFAAMAVQINWDDTIVALATPQGVGAIGVIRLSGKKAIEICNAIFPSKDLAKQDSHTLHIGFIRDDKKVVDEAVVSLFKSPKSYTGEDVVEISCHGSPYIQQQLLQLCISKGARLARAGEFTQRAFLNGKLDLTQAEAVADIIASNSEKSKQVALNQMRGGFSGDLQKLRDELIHFAALIELELDFSEEDIAFADRDKLVTIINRIENEITPLIESFKTGNVIKHGIPVAIVGKPNSGKSTLLNALLNEERAIVSDIAGTTRDTIEETLQLQGILYRFIDTAGLRHTRDEIEKIGVERSKEKIAQADIVLLVTDIHETVADILTQFDQLQLSKSQHGIIILNKLDTVSTCDGYDLEEAVATRSGATALAISAKNRMHMDKLTRLICEKSGMDKISTEGTIISNVRHLSALQSVLVSLKDIRKGIEENISGDLIAVDIRRALHHIGLITGSVELDRDILGTIFGKFCIGK